MESNVQDARGGPAESVLVPVGSGGLPQGEGRGTDHLERITERAPQKPVDRQHVTELKRLTTFRERGIDFWGSLPTSSKTFAILSFIDAVLVVAYAVWQFRSFGRDECQICAEHMHVVIAMLVTAFVFVFLVWDSIAHENDFELLASMLLSAFVSGRVLYFLFTADLKTYQIVVSVVLTLTFEALTMLFAYHTYKKFGWRVYSKLACDLRLKNAEEKLALYFRVHRFKTLLKLDLQFLILMMVSGTLMSASLEQRISSRPENIPNEVMIKFNDFYNLMLFVCTLLGFGLAVSWLILAGYAVQRDKKGLGPFLEFTVVLTLVLPVMAVVSVYADDKGSRRVARESLLIATAFFVLTRIAVWWLMRQLLNRSINITREEGDLTLNENFNKQANTNPDLLPLLKGAWLIKPSLQSPNKKRFFQLSQDLTTLRWAWNKYVLLYYVDELLPDDDHHCITLKFSMEPDLVLRFENAGDYEAWKRGISLLLTMLMAPDPGFDRCSLRWRPGRQVLQQHMNYHQQPTNTLLSFLTNMGIHTSKRHSTKDLSGNKFLGVVRGSSALIRADGAGGSGPQSSQASATSKTESLDRSQSGGGRRQGGDYVNVAPGRFIVQFPEHLGGDKAGKEKAANGTQQSLYPPPVPAPELQAGAGAASCSSSGSAGGAAHPTPVVPSQVFPSLSPIVPHMPIEQIDHADLEFGKFLGAGAEGAVWAAWYLETPVAVKKTDSMNEMEIIVSAGQHDNVVGVRGLCQEGSSKYLVLEYCPRGTLDVMLHHTRQVRWEPTKVLQMITCIARGMLHLHTRKPAILHRDLKPANIFIGHGLVLKIGDFGMSRHVYEIRNARGNECGNGPVPSRDTINRTFTRGVIGTAAYAAPELLDERLQDAGEYSKSRMLKADVYSFGVCVWEIVTRERPQEGMNYYEIVAQWTNDPDSMRLPPLPLPKDASGVDQKLRTELGKLIDCCCNYDANKRPDFKQILRQLRTLHTDVKQGTVTV